MAMFEEQHREHVITLQIGHETNQVLSWIWSARELDLLDEEGNLIGESSYHLSNEKGHLTPKCVMVDNQFNELNETEMIDIKELQKSVPWGGVSVTVDKIAALGNSRFRSKTPYYNKSKFHAKSFITYPSVDEKENSHWFYQRKANNGIRETTDHYEELAIDSLRYFAEASDRVDAIDTYADIYGDLGYVNHRLLEKIRDDFGKSVSLPVWLLDHRAIYDFSHRHHSRLAPMKTNQLFSSSLVLNYSSLLETADLLIPLQIPVEANIPDPTDRLFHYRLTGAVALETCLAHRLSHRGENLPREEIGDVSETTPSPMSTKEWIQLTSHGYRLPIASMEAFIPALTDDVELTPDYLLQVLDTFKESPTSSPSCSFPHRYQYNPFMKSFALPSMKTISDRVSFLRPHSNLLAMRGWNDPGFIEQLYLHCVSSPYLVTKCTCSSYWLPMKWNDRYSFSSDQFFAATAIGTNAWLGEHLREEVVKWYEEAVTSLPQYQKVDLGKEDLENKRELLLQLSEEY